jgi:CRISPR-associated protein (TIGR03984 family)
MKIRQIDEIQRQVQPVTVVAAFENGIADWLVGQAQDHSLTTMLAYADDGVIWGKIDQGQLLTSRDAFPGKDISPPLRPLTLQQIRLFGPNAELLLWRAESEWQARLIVEGTGEKTEFFDEWQILWGTRREAVQEGFTLVADGALGHRHAPPVEVSDGLFTSDENRRPLRLQVRHYLESAPDSGLLRVALSRLVRVTDETQVGKEQVQ